MFREKNVNFPKTALAEPIFFGYSLTTHKKQEKARIQRMEMEKQLNQAEYQFPTAEKIARSFHPEDPARIYLNEISHLKVLTEEEEQALAVRAAGGEEAAREALVDSGALRVVSIAREYVYRGLNSLDLLEMGNNALMDAVRSYNPDSSYPFTAYAAWRIRKTMTDALGNFSSVIRDPRLDMGLPEPLDQEPEGNPAMARWMLEEHMGFAIREKDWIILASRFGCSGHRPLNLSEAAEMMGLTRDHIRVAEYRTIRRSRAQRAKKIRDFYNAETPAEPEGEE